MIKARIWIVDEDLENFKIYETFSMLPTDKWEDGSFSEQIENYRFSFVFTKLKTNRKEKYDISGSKSNNKATI